MKRLTGFLLVLALFLNCLTVIASNNVTLEFWIAGNDESMHSAYRKVVDAYVDEHPNVKINMNLIAWSEYFTKLSTSFVGGTSPDVYALGFGQFYSMAGNNSMLNLAPYLPEDWDGYQDIPKSILDLGRIGGEIHALLVPEGRCLYYRKDIAREQGVSEDDLTIETLDDLIALAKKMTIKEGNEIIVEGLDLTTISPEQPYFIYGLMEGASTLWDNDLQPLFNDSAFIRGLLKSKSLLDEGYAIPQSAGISYFQTDVAAMSITTQTGIEGAVLPAIQDLGGEIGVVRLPFNVLLGQWYAVSSATKLPKESADFLVYLFSKEAQASLIDSFGQISSRSSLMESYYEGNELRKAYSEAVQEARPYGHVPNKYFLTWVNDLRSTIEGVYAGTSEAQAAMDAFCDRYKTICELQ